MELIGIPWAPEVIAGDDLLAHVAMGCALADLELRAEDVIVLCQKVVSKSEGRAVALDSVVPGHEALDLAARTNRDPRIVELILRESTQVLRATPHVIVVRHRTGVVLANAGIDQSNVRQSGEGVALLWPQDPDASARALRHRLMERYGFAVGVIINDSIGRAWRRGTVGTAIGAAGIDSLMNLRGVQDRHGRALQSTEVGHADELAAAASLVMGQAAEGVPMVIVRGLKAPAGNANAAQLLRPAAEDLFQ
ncbi:coenzyme F420-0:L-glutamate ligase [Hydrogenophaga sp.]|uniref:coenzyme F420-0:L-glutamate ligase n=1 Tax=Hydrogenophaga sp. TaxID=1904254 RepID=UPI00272359A3|nr:coenzyme F420-0:L-glutamate ligase [Hydrogenophaga sp.]MDO9435905.1 coenzyme F420-0:L-glutamate ligase [Hydrogenophaga sp.]